VGTITGTQIVARARRVLQDQTSGGTRWLDAEVLDWINDAQREIVLVKPESKSTIEDLVCVTGTKQTLPSTAVRLLAVIRNTNGRAIRKVDRFVLDSENPNWHLASPSAVAEHFVFDDDAPTTFYLYPPQPAADQGSVEVNYSASPVDLAALTNTIDLADIYANPILDYLLYRAYSKDTEYAGNEQRAMTHYSAFYNSLGVKTQGEAAAGPRMGLGPR
jgi:hypothetical protein